MPNLFEHFRVHSKFGEAKVTKKREKCQRDNLFFLLKQSKFAFFDILLAKNLQGL